MTEQTVLPGTDSHTRRETIAINKIRVVGEALPPPPRQLMNSIEVFGLINPISVVAIDGTDEYRLIAGRRRLSVACNLGWKEIEATIHVQGYVNEAAASLTENAARGPNPIEEMNSIGILLEKGNGLQEIAQLTGMPVQTIRKRLKLSRLTGEAKNLAASGVIAEGVAEAMSDLTPDHQEALIAHAKDGKVTAADVREARTAAKQQTWQKMGTGLEDTVEDVTNPSPVRPWQEIVASYLEQALVEIPDVECDIRDGLLTVWEVVRGIR